MPSIYRNGIQYSSNGGLESAAITAGVIVPYAGNTAPVGWLLCDGSAVSRTTYSVLFDVIGTTYGSGDGSTTFNVPDLRGRLALGAGTGTASDATAHSLGQKAGEETHTLSIDEMPSHTHDIAGSTSMGASDLAAYGSSRVGTGFNVALARGGGQAHNNMPPYTAVNYIISIGSQNGGFTHIEYDSQSDTYNGGIEDEYLLTDNTITALESWLNS